MTESQLIDLDPYSQLSSESLTGKSAPMTHSGGKRRPPRKSVLCRGQRGGSGGPKKGNVSYLWYDRSELLSLGSVLSCAAPAASQGKCVSSKRTPDTYLHPTPGSVNPGVRSSPVTRCKLRRRTFITSFIAYLAWVSSNVSSV